MHQWNHISQLYHHKLLQEWSIASQKQEKKENETKGQRSKDVAWKEGIRLKWLQEGKCKPKNKDEINYPINEKYHPENMPLSSLNGSVSDSRSMSQVSRLGLQEVKDPCRSYK